jgi:hypothetical protein
MGRVQVSEEDRRLFAEIGGWRQFEKNAPRKAKQMDIDWILTAAIKVTKTGTDDDPVYVIEERGVQKPRECIIRYQDGRMLFNGEDIKTEDFMAYVGLLDEADDGVTLFAAGE